MVSSHERERERVSISISMLSSVRVGHWPVQIDVGNLSVSISRAYWPHHISIQAERDSDCVAESVSHCRPVKTSVFSGLECLWSCCDNKVFVAIVLLTRTQENQASKSYM